MPLLDYRDIRKSASPRALDANLLEQYLLRLKTGRPNLSQMKAEEIYDLMDVTREGTPAIAAVQLFGLVSQAYFSQMRITAVSLLNAVEKIYDDLKRMPLMYGFYGDFHLRAIKMVYQDEIDVLLRFLREGGTSL